MTLSGGCLCGRIRYQASGPPDWVAHCHCRHCQRVSGAAFLTFVIFANARRVVWSGLQRAVYHSSPEVERGFCPECGSTLSFERPALDEMSVLAGTLDEPNSVAPSMHVFTDHRCVWLQLADELPSHGRFPPDYTELDTDPR